MWYPKSLQESHQQPPGVHIRNNLHHEGYIPKKNQEKNHQVITYEYKNMEKIERKINISDDLNFNFFQIWGTSYNAKNKWKLKKLSKSSPRYEKVF